jgi:phosphatidylinositol-bisphosphatase
VTATTTMNPAFNNRRASSTTMGAAATLIEPAAPVESPVSSSSGSVKKAPMKVLEHEYVFWMGDLNYRLEEEIELVEIFERLYNETWDNLRAADQLLLERAKQNIFHGFNEGLLSFPPTYKYQPGTDAYDQRPDKKIRAPAWCDRVLWRSTRMDRDVTMLHYRAAPLHMSDHKPVSAMFICNTRKVLKDKLKLVYADLLLTVDKWINESKPKVEVNNRQIELGPIVHNVSQRACLLLVYCYFHFAIACPFLV